MKKLLLKVTSGPSHSFSYTRERRKVFYDEFHYHPELELSLVLKGRGTRFVGDHVEAFKEGDLILLGENLPHMWRSGKEYYRRKARAKCESITIHFKSDFLGDTFLKLPECAQIRSLLRKTSAGIKLTGICHDHVAELMMSMGSQSAMEKLLTLLNILQIISDEENLRVLSGRAMTEAYGDQSDGRIGKVHQYIVTNFRNGIKLEEIAEVANLSPTAFCRFFKQRTKKSFSEFVMQTKVNYACQLLQTNDMSISQIAYESGYTNLSNFNRQFKRETRLTPNMYKKKFIGKL